MIILIALLAYLIGPLIYQLFRSKHSVLSALDGMLFVVIAAFCLSIFAVEVTEVSFLPGVLLFLVGIFVPNFLEKTFHSQKRNIHNIFILLSVLAFYGHVYLEMQVLADVEYIDSLDLGILLHRIPIGLLIWWLVFPRFGLKVASCAIAGVIAFNLLGYFLPLSLSSYAYLEIFVAGAILHVVLFSFHGLPKIAGAKQVVVADCCSAESHSHSSNIAKYEFIGNLIGLFIAWFVLSGFDHQEHGHGSTMLWAEFIELAYLTAPALVAGLILSVLIKFIFPEKTLSWVNRGTAVSQSIKGTIFGIPLPICSCGILPIYQGLVKKGIMPAASISFLIATPEIGLDAILISLPLLGSEFTILRVLVAFFFAFVMSLILYRFIPQAKISKLETAPDPKEEKSLDIIHSLRHLADEIIPWVIIGLIVSAIFNLANIDFIAEINVFLQIFLAAVLGLVVYVCASGVTPVIAALLLAGLSPGAAITFLLVGPASNISTLGVLTNLHGKKFSSLFAVASIIISILFGLLVNLLFRDGLSLSSDMLEHSHHSDKPGWWEILAILALTLVVIEAGWRKGLKKFLLRMETKF